ncbi:MAG: hypothetical protein RSB77_07335 [Bacilli bacterium]|uniref:DUF6873 family GME fold protein n=1 Tax=Clostridium sp. TaxID=1506 RepID=UPI0030256CDA
MKYAFVDSRISSDEILNLKALNCDVILCEPCDELYDAICGHPDILLHFINNGKVIIHKNSSNFFEKKLLALGIEVLRSQSLLTPKYPSDIILNAVNTTNFFLHNINHTDKRLLQEIAPKKLINVNQGYTKCSTVILSEKAFITSDNSIYTTLINLGYDVLLLPPGDILLPGLDYGFIGGTCGMLNSDTIVFYGNLNSYSHGNMVKAFLEKHNITPIYLSNSPLIDRGSIFFIDL